MRAIAALQEVDAPPGHPACAAVVIIAATIFPMSMLVIAAIVGWKESRK